VCIPLAEGARDDDLGLGSIVRRGHSKVRLRASVAAAGVIVAFNTRNSASSAFMTITPSQQCHRSRSQQLA
jgi:hypothetical protein